MKQNIEVTVRGKSGAEYGFIFKGDTKYLDEWRADGLEVHEVYNVIPLWVQQAGLTRVWCRVQDLWRFLRLW